ncbi:virulence plasmid 65kDa B protein-domain-containing protein [Cladorrhinum sp. PSN259]|nr:virulence plasmid 65kDa B protein-domain-containing protein [Cladorrhinum sp. PSN259]
MDAKPGPVVPVPGQPRQKRGSETASSGAANQAVREPAGDSGQSSGHKEPDPSPLKVPIVEAANFLTGRGGGAIRAIDDKFKVNPSSGTLSLTLPLPVTPARAGFQPSLDLKYDSGGGNGIFGIGWSLSLGNIRRKTSKRVPRYNDTDVFVLSGIEEDLVPVDAEPTVRDGYSVRKYRPRVEEQVALIEMFTNVDDISDVYWRTISANNVTNIYGRTADSRVADSSFAHLGTRIFSWLLCESYDASGNAIMYAYKAENAEGFSSATGSSFAAKHVKSIKYGNRAPCRDADSWEILPLMQIAASMEWLFEIVFDYGEHDLKNPDAAGRGSWNLRPDCFSTRTSGFEIRTSRLCQRILMFHHIPEELQDKQDYLVSSTTLEYQANPVASFLSSVVHRGHVWNGKDSYDGQNLAPYTFEYLQLPKLQDVKLQSTRPACLQTLPVTRHNSITRWIDLDGEGLTGLLFMVDGAWYYERNENVASAGLVSSAGDSEDDIESGSETEGPEPQDFGPVRRLLSMPNLRNLDKSHLFEDLDGNGVDDLVTLDENGRLRAYYERTDNGEWMPAQTFESVPNISITDKRIERLDLTGDGKNDILTMDNSSGEVTWRESLGKKGFGPELRCQATSSNQGTLPRILTSDSWRTTYMADMTGDGLADIVEVMNGRFSYWPNLGHGRFGAEVVMDGSPVFDADDVFSFERVHLLDVDGSGTTDVIYLAPTGGAIVYFNQCGNAFSRATVVSAFPPLNSLSSVFVADILGNGTSCLCWLGPDGGANEDLILFYLDVTAGRKPYLLRSYSNGIGLTTTVTHAASTKYYLKDERAGRPWKTKLPFPVHVVSKTVEKDSISCTSRTTKYKYHDGFYDGFEREFRGFGLVDMHEAETFFLDGPDKKPYRKPTCLTKLWFLTGAPDASTLVPSGIFGGIPLKCELGDTTTSFRLREAYRTLKGLPLRTEIFQLDGTSRDDVPVSTREHSYEVIPIQAARDQQVPGISRVGSRETLTTVYERERGPPRIQHELILERNEYGNVTKSVTIGYGIAQSLLTDARSKQAQKAHDIVYTETGYTNAVAKSQNVFYAPLVAGRRGYRVFDLSIDGLLDIGRLRKDGCSLLAASEVRGSGSSILDLEGSSALNNISRVLKTEMQTIYRRQDLTGPLKLGQFQAFSVVDRVYRLAMSPVLTNNAYGSDERYLGGEPFANLAKEAGYIEFEDRKGWWWESCPESRFRHPSDKKTPEVNLARSKFYTPTASVDSFGNVHTVELDKLMLLADTSTDPVGNITRVTNNYRCLKPEAITDSNGNRTMLGFDALGRNTATARAGKAEEHLGDSLEGVHFVVTEEEALAGLVRPDLDHRSLAQLLGRASRREIHYHAMSSLGLPDQEKAVRTPSFRLDLARAQHSAGPNESLASPENLLAKFTYFDGRGTAIQELSIADWGSSSSVIQWAVTQCTIADYHGTAIKGYKPFFNPDHFFQKNPGTLSTAATVSLRDILQREVGTLNPDHTWTKVAFTPWAEVNCSAGDLVSISDPRDDPDVGKHFRALETALFLPVWSERDVRTSSKHETEAAQKSALYANRPQTTHINTSQWPILHVESDGDKGRTKRVEYDVHGNIVLEVDSLGRTVQKSQYDLLGHCTLAESMDSGRVATVYDCAGKNIIFTCNSRGVAKKETYDGLRRKVEVRVRDREHDTPRLWSKTAYGEESTDAERRNLRGRVAQVWDQSGTRKNTAFDFKGNLVSSTSQQAVDYKSALDWSSSPALEQDIYTVATMYDALDRPHLSTDANGVEVRRTYHLLGGLKSISSSVPEKERAFSQSYIDNIVYGADARPVKVSWGNGVVTTYEYDAETTRITHKNSVRKSDGAVLEDIRYTYEIEGRISNMTNSANHTVFSRNYKIDPSNDYWYDRYGRLIKTTGRESISADGKTSRSLGSMMQGGTSSLLDDGTLLAMYTETYEYDHADNLLSMHHESADARVGVWIRTYTYTEPSLLEEGKTSNRLSSSTLRGEVQQFGYDEDAGAVGCMTSMPGYSRLVWDCNGKLRCTAKQTVASGEPESTWYVYDSEGRRVRKVTERSAESRESGSQPGRILKQTFYLGGGAERHYRYKGDGSTSKMEKYTSTITVAGLEAASPIALLETDNVFGEEGESPTATTLARYSLSTSLEVDAAGQLVSYEEYSPWGHSVLLACRSDIEAPSAYRYASYRRDGETGLCLAGARYYAPWLGRWTAPDPLGTADGMNVFAYVADDPVNWTDPTGTMREGVSVEMTDVRSRDGAGLEHQAEVEAQANQDDVVIDIAPDAEDEAQAAQPQQAQAAPDRPLITGEEMLGLLGALSTGNPSTVSWSIVGIAANRVWERVQDPVYRAVRENAPQRAVRLYDRTMQIGSDVTTAVGQRASAVGTSAVDGARAMGTSAVGGVRGAWSRLRNRIGPPRGNHAEVHIV